MNKPFSYQDAGVNIEEGNRLVTDIKQIAAGTRRPGLLSDIGGFGALFELPTHLQHPVLVSSTDGVGTKLKFAIDLQQHAGIGIDLVAMCANDIICQGAEPLFFLDYYATGKLDREQAKIILQSISQGCQQANMALIGGETAEMPGLYQQADYDLAGFCVGVVEKNNIIDGSKVQVGDQLIALRSNGVHANGFSLIRRIIDHHSINLQQAFADTTLGEHLLTPTRIYVQAITTLLKAIDVHAIAHITGGGLIENLPRVLPNYTDALIATSTWTWPDIFQWLQQQGNIAQLEMYRTFNVGVGMVICVSAANVDASLSLLAEAGEQSWVIGEIIASEDAKAKLVFS